MKRATALIVLALLMLIAVAFLVRREPDEPPARRAPKRAPVVETAVQEPVAALPPLTPRPVKAPASQPEPVVPVVAASGNPGTVRGRVRIKGEIPQRKTARLSSDPKCAAMHAGPVLVDDIVTDSNGFVQWAFVHVQSGFKGEAPPPPQTLVTLDQVACTFTPHMVGIRAGQSIRVLNSDALLHNVHGLPFTNKEFNVGLTEAGTEVVRKFDFPEVMVKVKCDIHPWMAAWVGVVEHPYFSVTNETGSYNIPGLPPGRYRLQAWHEKYSSVSLEVELPPGGDVALDFVLDALKQ